MTKEDDRIKREELIEAEEKIKALFGVAPERLGRAEKLVVSGVGFLYEYYEERKRGEHNLILLPISWRQRGIEPGSTDSDKEVTYPFWYRAAEDFKEVRLEISLPFVSNKRELALYGVEEAGSSVICIRDMLEVPGRHSLIKSGVVEISDCQEKMRRVQIPPSFTRVNLEEMIGLLKMAASREFANVTELVQTGDPWQFLETNLRG